MENESLVREKEGKKEGMRQIAKRSHHATSPVPFLSSLAHFSLLPSKFYSSSTPISYLLPTTECRAKLFQRLSTQSDARPCRLDDFERTKFMILGTRDR